MYKFISYSIDNVKFFDTRQPKYRLFNSLSNIYVATDAYEIKSVYENTV